MPCKNNPYTIAVLYESSDDINRNYYVNDSGMEPLHMSRISKPRPIPESFT
jgi:hypothetical protein